MSKKLFMEICSQAIRLAKGPEAWRLEVDIAALKSRIKQAEKETDSEQLQNDPNETDSKSDDFDFQLNETRAKLEDASKKVKTLDEAVGTEVSEPKFWGSETMQIIMLEAAEPEDKLSQNAESLAALKQELAEARARTC